MPNIPYIPYLLCTFNGLGYVDNWSLFWEQPALYRRDRLHPSSLGSVILSRNIERAIHSLRSQDHYDTHHLVMLLTIFRPSRCLYQSPDPPAPMAARREDRTAVPKPHMSARTGSNSSRRTSAVGLVGVRGFGTFLAADVGAHGSGDCYSGVLPKKNHCKFLKQP
ncbi:hypothetical protein AOLI_G00065150 [Acnodon oligacanthus]